MELELFLFPVSVCLPPHVLINRKNTYAFIYNFLRAPNAHLKCVCSLCVCVVVVVVKDYYLSMHHSYTHTYTNSIKVLGMQLS